MAGSGGGCHSTVSDGNQFDAAIHERPLRSDVANSPGRTERRQPA